MTTTDGQFWSHAPMESKPWIPPVYESDEAAEVAGECCWCGELHSKGDPFIEDCPDA